MLGTGIVTLTSRGQYGAEVVVPCRSRCAAGASLLMPKFESVRLNHTIGVGGKSVSTRMEMTVDEGVSGKEALGLLGRFEPLHLSLSSSRRSVRFLGPIIQISAVCRCSTPGSS